MPSRVFKTDEASSVSLIVTASFPKPLIPLDAYAVFAAAAVPVKVVTVAAFIATVVLLSSVFKFEAATDASVTDIVSACPDSVIPLSVDISLSLTVAVKTPVVYPARVLT